MSRILRKPCQWGAEVEITRQDDTLQVRGPKGQLSLLLHPSVEVTVADRQLTSQPKDSRDQSRVQAATTHSLIGNMITGVTQGFTCKILLSGVGYRGQVKGRKLELTLGLSHPVVFDIPEGVKITSNSPTEFDIEGCDKQQVGEVAACLRRLRPPEPYGGKGVMLADETIRRKVVKKK